MTIRKTLIGAAAAILMMSGATMTATAGQAYNSLVMSFVVYEAECGGFLPEVAQKRVEADLAAMSESDQAIAIKRLEAVKARLGNKMYCKVIEQQVFRFMY